MDGVLRAAVVYIVLLVLFRVAGKRALGQLTTFDLVLVLIVSEGVGEALSGGDPSLGHAIVVVVTLVVIDVAFAWVKTRLPRFEQFMEGRPIVILVDGRPIEDVMDRFHVDCNDVLAAARELQGIERLEDIRLAVLERNGRISVVPTETYRTRRG